MVDRNLLRDLDPPDDELRDADDPASATDAWRAVGPAPRVGTKVVGRAVAAVGGDLVVDVGAKAEGRIPLADWTDWDEDPPRPGDPVEVLLEGRDDATGAVVLSRWRERWRFDPQPLEHPFRPGDVVRGRVLRLIRGGLLVDIGVNAFLPAGRLEPPALDDLGSLVGRDVDCVVVSVDGPRRHVVLACRGRAAE